MNRISKAPTTERSSRKLLRHIYELLFFQKLLILDAPFLRRWTEKKKERKKTGRT